MIMLLFSRTLNYKILMGSTFTAFFKVSLQASACFFYIRNKDRNYMAIYISFKKLWIRKVGKRKSGGGKKKLYWCCIQNKTCAKIYSKEQDYYLSSIIKQFKNEWILRNRRTFNFMSEDCVRWGSFDFSL